MARIIHIVVRIFDCVVSRGVYHVPYNNPDSENPIFRAALCIGRSGAEGKSRFRNPIFMPMKLILP